MDWTTIITTLLAGLGDVGPVTYLSLLVSAGLGYVWFTDRRAHDGQLKSLRDEYSAMVQQKDARNDARDAAMQTALDAAHQQLAALNRDYSAANKDTAEIVNQVAQTLACLAADLKDRQAARPERRG